MFSGKITSPRKCFSNQRLQQSWIFFGANKNIIWTIQFLNALLELFYQFNSTKEPSNSEVHQKQIRSVVGWDDMNRIQNTNWYEQDQKKGQANISKVVRKFQLVQIDQICTGIEGRNVWEFLWFKKKVSGIAVCHKSPQIYFNIYHILAVGVWGDLSTWYFPFYFRHLKSWREEYSSAEERGLMMKSPKCKVLTSFNILCAPTGLLRPRIFYWWCQTLMAGFSNFYRYKHPILHIKQDLLQYFYFYKIKKELTCFLGSSWLLTMLCLKSEK